MNMFKMYQFRLKRVRPISQFVQIDVEFCSTGDSLEHQLLITSAYLVNFPQFLASVTMSQECREF